MSKYSKHVWESTCQYWLNDMYKPLETNLYHSRTRAIKDAIETIRYKDSNDHEVKELGNTNKKDYTVVRTVGRQSKQYIIRKKYVL